MNDLNCFDTYSVKFLILLFSRRHKIINKIRMLCSHKKEKESIAIFYYEDYASVIIKFYMSFLYFTRNKDREKILFIYRNFLIHKA